MRAPELSVIVPLEDPRADIVDNIGTWTRDQTLGRDRFQLVAGADGRHLDFEQSLAATLEPQDEIVSVPSAPLMGLYDAAARAARAPVLVFTEAHVRAEPDCLEAVAELFAADPSLDAATFHHSQGTTGDVSKLSERWFRRVHDIWDRQDWPRLNIGGVAIRAETYLRAGGLIPELELFAPAVFSARVHSQGGRVRHLPAARVTHLLEDTMPESLEHSKSFVRGECLARTTQDPEFLDRYFGPAGIWERRLTYRPAVSAPMLAALAAAIRENPREAGWLAWELAARLPSRIAAERPRWAWERGMAALNSALASASIVPFERRWQSYIVATDHTLSAIRLREGAEGNGLPEPLSAGKALSALDIDGVLIGAHGLEHADGRAFRWTEPVALLRVDAPAGGVLRIETGGLRGTPTGYLHSVHAGSGRIDPELVGQDESSLEIQLPADLPSTSELVLICRPLLPGRERSGDGRRLGMPVFGIELR